MKKKIIARWESRGGAHWVELYRDEYGYGYSANDASGFLGRLATDSHAILLVGDKVDSGYFLPDAARTPMRRIR